MPQAFVARAERLLCSVAGIAAARIDLDEGNRITSIRVVADKGSSAKQVMRNAQSALTAGLRAPFNVRCITVVAALDESDRKGSWGPVAMLELLTGKPVAAAPKAAVPIPVSVSAPAPAANSPVPRIEFVELIRRDGDPLRCRVVIEMGSRRTRGAAEADEDNTGVSQLAAQATLDALRDLDPRGWEFSGAADVIIAGHRHIVVSLREVGSALVVSGAAMVHQTLEQAVAVAVLNAVGAVPTAAIEVKAAPRILKRALAV